MKITIATALANYYEDLCYNGLYWDRDNINYYSSGTPEFESDADMNAYIDAIRSLLAKEDV